jgi:hypothetical protein
MILLRLLFSEKKNKNKNLFSSKILLLPFHLALNGYGLMAKKKH